MKVGVVNIYRLVMKVQFLNIVKRAYGTSIHELLPKDSKITRVRIWKSGYFDRNNRFISTNVIASFFSAFKPGREPNLGHVSVETRDFYASLWPDGIDVFNKLKPQEGYSKTSNPRDDELAEGKPPDHLVDLHTLDVVAIKEELDRFVGTGSKYHVIGRNRFFRELGANSCSGLAHDLLTKGGIDKLASRTHLIRDFVVTTPNNLISLVLEAKDKEQKISKIEKTEPDGNSIAGPKN